MKKHIIFKQVTLDEIRESKREHNAVMEFVDNFLNNGCKAIEIDYTASGYKTAESARNAFYVAARRLNALKHIRTIKKDGRLFLVNMLLVD